ncbi:MAG: hypothetical protein OEM02_09800 [Desulfobulbaceae bacterium]|nr:hypothetical protein [Desulfobulbaceae bacterium]
MKLICDPNFQHFSKDVIAEFERAIIKLSHPSVVYSKNPRLNDLVFKLHRRLPYGGKMVFNGDEDYFSILMGVWYLAKTYPYFLKARRRSIYLFDAWFTAHDVIEKLSKVVNLDTIFFSSLQAKNTFEEKGIPSKCIWIPEGLTPNDYYLYDYEKKDIEVLNFGRKWTWYHDLIKDPLENKGISYLYEKKWFNVIFKTHDEFKRGLARSKISICFPKNISHPTIAGSISTMTNRYLQSMVSKSLIVGLMPEEMKLLFDYTPIIEIDPKHPAEQLMDILAHYDDYIPLIEKNYEIVCSHHTWENRWIEIAKHLGVPCDKI